MYLKGGAKYCNRLKTWFDPRHRKKLRMTSSIPTTNSSMAVLCRFDSQALTRHFGRHPIYPWRGGAVPRDIIVDRLLYAGYDVDDWHIDIATWRICAATVRSSNDFSMARTCGRTTAPTSQRRQIADPAGACDVVPTGPLDMWKRLRSRQTITDRIVLPRPWRHEVRHHRAPRRDGIRSKLRLPPTGRMHFQS